MLTKFNTIIDRVTLKEFYRNKFEFNNEEMLPSGFTKEVMAWRYVAKKGEHDKMVHCALDFENSKGN
jgi:hypothetical protein